MKRPVFWAVIWFALGEVTLIHALGWVRYLLISIWVLLPIVCTLKKIISTKQMFILIALYFMGMCRVLITPSELSGLGMGLGFDMCDFKQGEGIVEKHINDNTVVRIRYSLLENKQTGETGYSTKEYKILCYNSGDLKVGQTVILKGELSQFTEPTNPGCFNMRRYYKSKQILFFMYSPDITVSDEGYNHLAEFLQHIRDISVEKIKNMCDEQIADIYICMLLGDKSYLMQDIKRTFQMVNISHIISISALHLSLIGGTLYKMLRKMGMKFGNASFFVVLLVVLYGYMTGFSVATVRATVMLVIYLLGQILGRKYDMLTGGAIALGVVIGTNPYALLDGGLLLSFGAVLGVFIGDYLFRYYKELFGLNKSKYVLLRRFPVFEKLASGIVMSAAIQLVLFPILISMYYEFSPYSLFVNVLVVPLMTIVIGAGFAGLIISYINISLANVIILPGVLVIKLYIWLCERTIELPFSVVNTGMPPVICIIIFYMMLGLLLLLTVDRMKKLYVKINYFIFRKTVTRKSVLLITLVIQLFMFSLLASIDVVVWSLLEKEQFIVMDVGQGDGSAIRTADGVVFVIDGGSTSEKQLGEYTLIPCLKYFHMANVDYWFVSHSDEDHISGLVYILENEKLSGIRIKNIVLSGCSINDETDQTLIRLAHNQRINIIYMCAGDMVGTDHVNIVCCHPDKEFSSEDKNQNSLVLSYSDNVMKALFTGDADEVAIDYMMNRHGDLLCKHYDYLKVPHHGSKYSISKNLYNEIRFDNAIVSCGENNRYGHPHNETIDLLSRYGIEIWRTDEQGAMVEKRN